MDNAFPTAPYPGMTTDQLKAAIAEGRGNERMVAELKRRERRDAGDITVMTAGERLRHLKMQNSPLVADLVSYAHRSSPLGHRFRQYASDPLPEWAVNVRPEPKDDN